jgi:lipopolysaccharide export system protein LptA
VSYRGWFSAFVVLVNLVVPLGSGFAQAQPKGKYPVTITSDRLEVNRKLHTAVYTGNVMADDKDRDMVVLADKMEFLFDEKMERIQKGIATGNVRATIKEKRVTADRLELFPDEDKAVLTGNPRAWQDNDLITGTKMTIFSKEDRAIVEGEPSKRVTAILYPKSEGAGRSEPQVPGKIDKPATTQGGP